MRKHILISLCGALSLIFLVQRAVAASTELVSGDFPMVAFTEGGPSISADGRFVAFATVYRMRGVWDTNDSLDVYVNDRLTNTYQRASVDSAGREGDGDSYEPAISGNGRFVVFTSTASNFLPVNRPYREVYIHDMVTGATERVNTHPPYICDPEQEGACGNERNELNPAINFDGRFVGSVVDQGAYCCWTNLYVRNMQTGVTTEIVHGTDTFNGAASSNRNPSMSGDGGFLAWECDLEDPGNYDIELCSRDLSASATTARWLKTKRDAGRRVGTTRWETYPSVSGNGRFVAFASATEGYKPLLILRDRSLPATKSDRVINLIGAQYGMPHDPSITPNGRFVAYAMNVGNASGVFVWDRLNGFTQRIDVRPDNTPASATSGLPAINADGRFIAFSSNANDLVPAPDNRQSADPRIFLRDREIDRDDVLVDFGSHGLWQFMNNRRWVQVNTASPGPIAAGDLDGSYREDAIGWVQGQGVLARYDNVAPWKRLLGAPASRLVACDLDGDDRDDLVVDRGSLGLWVLYGGTRLVKLSPETSRKLICANLDGDGRDELVASLVSGGLWAFYNNQTWTKLQTVSPFYMAAGDLDGNGLDEIAADLGSGVFIRYNNQPPWQKFKPIKTQGLAIANLDGDPRKDLLVILPSGLWMSYEGNPSSFIRRHPQPPKDIITADIDHDHNHQGGVDDIVISLPTGLWVSYSLSYQWTKLRDWPVQTFASGSFD